MNTYFFIHKNNIGRCNVGLSKHTITAPSIAKAKAQFEHIFLLNPDDYHILEHGSELATVKDNLEPLLALFDKIKRDQS